MKQTGPTANSCPSQTFFFISQQSFNSWKREKVNLHPRTRHMHAYVPHIMLSVPKPWMKSHTVTAGFNASILRDAAIYRRNAFCTWLFLEYKESQGRNCLITGDNETSKPWPKRHHHSHSAETSARIHLKEASQRETLRLTQGVDNKRYVSYLQWRRASHRWARARTGAHALAHALPGCCTRSRSRRVAEPCTGPPARGRRRSGSGIEAFSWLLVPHSKA